MIRFSLILYPTTKVFDIQHCSSVFLRCSRTCSLNIRSISKIGQLQHGMAGCNLTNGAFRLHLLIWVSVILSHPGHTFVESCFGPIMNSALWLTVCTYIHIHRHVNAHMHTHRPMFRHRENLIQILSTQHNPAMFDITGISHGLTKHQWYMTQNTHAQKSPSESFGLWPLRLRSSKHAKTCKNDF